VADVTVIEKIGCALHRAGEFALGVLLAMLLFGAVLGGALAACRHTMRDDAELRSYSSASYRLAERALIWARARAKDGDLQGCSLAAEDALVIVTRGLWYEGRLKGQGGDRPPSVEKAGAWCLREGSR